MEPMEIIQEKDKKIFILAGHGCRGTMHNDKKYIHVVPKNTILIYFNTYGTTSQGKDSIIFMQKLYEINRPLFDYIIDPKNYIQNIDRTNIKSYRHKDFFKNYMHKIYSNYNPISNIDMYVHGMKYYDGYINWTNKEGSRELHGVYEIGKPVIEQSIKSNIKKEIDKINTANGDTYNIIFCSICRLVEIRIENIFDMMPHITAIKYFPEQNLIEYFSEDKLKKIFKIVQNDMNNILIQKIEDIEFNIVIRKLELIDNPEIVEHKSIFINQIQKLKEEIKDKNNFLEYITQIFNSEELFIGLYQIIKTQVDINIGGITEYFKQLNMMVERYPEHIIKKYNDLLMYISYYYIYNIVKIIDEIISINKEIINIQKSNLLLSYNKNFYTITINNLNELLRLQTINKNDNDKNILFQEVNITTILQNIYEQLKLSYRIYQEPYEKIIKDEIESKIFFNYKVYFAIITNCIISDEQKLRLIHIFFNNYDIEQKINLKFEYKKKEKPEIEALLSQEKQEIFNFLYSIFQSVSLPEINNSLKKLTNLFISAEDIDEQPSKRTRHAQKYLNYKEKYLKYKSKYLTLKNYVL